MPVLTAVQSDRQHHHDDHSTAIIKDETTCKPRVHKYSGGDEARWALRRARVHDAGGASDTVVRVVLRLQFLDAAAVYIHWTLLR